MNYDFSSSEELFNRVSPALKSKENEFKRLGYSNIKALDIWNYLIESKWKFGKGLMLSDIVNDIMKCDYKQIDSYLKKNYNEKG